MPRLRNPDGTFAPRADSPTMPVARRADNTVQNTLTFGGVPGVDKGASFQLAERELWMPQDIDLVVRQLGLAHRICKMVADDSTHAGWTVSDGDDHDIGDDVDERLSVRSKVGEALWTARVYGCALVAMMPKSPRVKLIDPMKPGEEIAAIQVYDGTEVFPQTWNVDPRSPGYRDPETWLITPQTIASAAAFTIHQSRVVYFFGARMPRRVRYMTPGLRWLDMSILELYRQAIIRSDRFDGAAITLAEAMDTAIFKIPGLVQILSGPPDQAAAAIQRWRVLAQQTGNVGLGTIDGGEDYERHPLTATGFDSLDATRRRALSEVEGIPQTKLFGDTPSGLNTDNESGRKQYESFIAGYQASHLTEQLRKLYAAALNLAPGSLHIKYHPIEPMSLAQTAAIELTFAQRDVALAGAGLIDASEVRGRLDHEEPTARYELAEAGDLAGELLADPATEQTAEQVPSGTETGVPAIDGAPAQVPVVLDTTKL